MALDLELKLRLLLFMYQGFTSVKLQNKSTHISDNGSCLTQTNQRDNLLNLKSLQVRPLTDSMHKHPLHEEQDYPAKTGTVKDNYI